MDDTSENTLEKTEGEQITLDELREHIDERLRYLYSRSEASINIGLSAHAEIKQLKNKQKLLEDSQTVLSTSKTFSVPKKDFVSDNKTEQIFNKLAKQWKEETVNLSSIQKISMNNAYLQIIGLGPVAIRLILNELERAPDFWFCALRALTRTNPVPPEMSGDLNAMTRVWLDWGQKHGYSYFPRYEKSVA